MSAPVNGDKSLVQLLDSVENCSFTIDMPARCEFDQGSPFELGQKVKELQGDLKDKEEQIELQKSTIGTLRQLNKTLTIENDSLREKQSHELAQKSLEVKKLNQEREQLLKEINQTKKTETSERHDDIHNTSRSSTDKKCRKCDEKDKEIDMLHKEAKELEEDDRKLKSRIRELQSSIRDSSLTGGSTIVKHQQDLTRIKELEKKIKCLDEELYREKALKKMLSEQLETSKKSEEQMKTLSQRQASRRYQPVLEPKDNILLEGKEQLEQIPQEKVTRFSKKHISDRVSQHEDLSVDRSLKTPLTVCSINSIKQKLSCMGTIKEKIHFLAFTKAWAELQLNKF